MRRELKTPRQSARAQLDGRFNDCGALRAVTSPVSAPPPPSLSSSHRWADPEDVQTQACAACRHCRLTSQVTPFGASGGHRLTSVDYHAGLDIPGRVISPAPMRTLTMVSASGPGPEWDVESGVGSTGPAPGRWLSDVPIVRGRACMITSTALSVGTRKSRNGTERNVALLAPRFNKASARPLAVARAVPNDESRLHIAHAYLVITTKCHTAVVNRTDGFRSESALATASGFVRACGGQARVGVPPPVPSRPG